MTTFFLLQLSVCLPLQTTLTVDGQGVIPVQHKQLSQKAGLTTCFSQLGPTNDDTPPYVKTDIANVFWIHSWK